VSDSQRLVECFSATRFLMSIGALSSDRVLDSLLPALIIVSHAKKIFDLFFYA
jgi:hypothetical protein